MQQLLAAERARLAAVERRQRPPARVLTFGAAQTPDLITHFNGRLEFIDVRIVGDRSAMMAPEEGRLGRRVRDVMPSDLTEMFMENLFYARRDKSLRWFTYTSPDGRVVRANMIAPSADAIFVTVRRLLTFTAPIMMALS